jgi:hypothetical protein
MLELCVLHLFVAQVCDHEMMLRNRFRRWGGDLLEDYRRLLFGVLLLSALFLCLCNGWSD